MKKFILTLAAVVGVSLFAGSAVSVGVAYDGGHHGRGHYGHNHSQGFGSYRQGYDGGYYRGSRGGNQVFLSTPGFSIGWGAPVVVRPYRVRPMYVPSYPYGYGDSCGW